MRESNEVAKPGRTLTTFLSIFVIAIMANVLFLATKADSQTGAPERDTRQVPAPLPKLALVEVVGELKNQLPYFRFVLMITNWEKYSSEMFLVPTGRKLPPNPCAEVTSRVVIRVYSEQGASLSKCIAMPKPADLGNFSYYFRRGPTPPAFVYVVVHDRYTGGSYKSNLISFATGKPK